MDKLLAKLQMFLFEKGSNKDFCLWDKLGNKVQDIRSKLTI